MQNTPLKISTLVLSIHVVLLASATAHAENDMPFVELETINITAQQADGYLEPEASSATGLNLTAQQTPQSITVITEEFIEDNNIENIEDLVQYTPGLTIDKFDGGKTFFYSRGFEIDDYQVDGMNVPRDQVWSTNDHLASTAIYEKAEVVRGANGLMTGSGTPSASVNMIRKRADDVSFSGKASARYDEHGGYGATIDISGGLNDSGNVRGRLIADYSDGDTYIDLQQMQNQTLYGVVDADLTDSTTVSIGVKINESNQFATMFGTLPAYYKDGTKTDYDVSKNTSPEWSVWNAEGVEYFATLEQQITDNLALEIKANHSETDAQNDALYLTDFAENDFPNIGVDKETGAGLFGLPARYVSNYESDTAQAKLIGDFDAFGRQHQFVFGGSYEQVERDTAVIDGDNPFFTLPDFNSWDGKGVPEPKWNETTDKTGYRDTKETGIFASTQLQLTDPLSVVIGTRFSNYKEKDEGNLLKKVTEAEEVWTPYVGATYEFAPNQSIFASYTDIFEPQRGRDSNGDLVGPVTGENYEIGIKGSNADDTLQAQVAFFYIKQDNLAQDTGTTFLGTVPPEEIYRVIDGATSKGVDAEITGKLTPNLQTSIGYTSFSARDNEDKKFNTFIPDEVFKVSTNYDMGNYIDGLSIGGGINYSGQRYLLLNNPTRKDANGAYQPVKYIQEPVLLANLIAKYEVNDNVALQLNVNNVFNEKYVNGSGFQKIHYGAPRTVTGKVSYKW